MNFNREEQIYFAFIYKNYLFTTFKNMIYSDNLEELCDIDRRPIPKEILERTCP